MSRAVVSLACDQPVYSSNLALLGSSLSFFVLLERSAPSFYTYALLESSDISSFLESADLSSFLESADLSSLLESTDLSRSMKKDGKEPRKIHG